MAADHSRVGYVRSGVLEVFVANSMWLQELTFRKTELLAALARSMPQQRLRGLRFKVAALDEN
jgi:predicted nucleic acid-binding Zn ribbon protein